MKKISKITLENFRVFSGENEIDFNNSDKKAGGFCLYIWKEWIWKNIII